MALLESEYSYLQTFKNQPNTIMDFSLLQRLDELGVDVRKLFSDSNVKSLQFQINIMAQHYYQKTIDSADEAIFILRSMAGRIKRSILSYIQ
jgi:predicted butyrate kinase (DUF1464 family)